MADIPDDLLKAAKDSLVGPAAPDEVLPDRPNEFYVLGLLFPVDTEREEDDFDTPDSAAGRSNRSDGHGASGTGRGADDAPEREHAAQHLPRSIGIRCRVASDAGKIAAEVRFATYEKTGSGWKRNPVTRTVPVSGDGREVVQGANGDALAHLTWRTDDDRDPSGAVILSVFLSNAMGKYPGTGPGSKDGKCERILFQPSIMLSGKEGSFADSGTTADRRLLMPDEIPLEMLYRERKVYARGYGCSADWNREGAHPTRVFTDLMPHYQSKWIEFGSESDDSLPGSIDMVDVEEAANPQDLYDMLKNIPEKYSRWISAEASAARDMRNDDYRMVLSDNVKKCARIRERIEDGLELLRDPARRDVYDAFKITNRVMLWQMSRYRWAGRRFKSGGGGGAPPDTSARGENLWRPFQVAFLLMNLRGMADAASDTGKSDRMTADLLWFPTGGGKTEAYMALAAFAMILRRLRRGDGDGAGVSIIMRYTLRLLTVQQFERAAALICALEHYRRSDPQKVLGTEPFLIGLWVGGQLTPNTHEGSAEALGGSGGNGGGRAWSTGSPSQLVFCPWCGSRMSNANYKVDSKKTKWTIARCLDKGCDFYSPDPLDAGRALPILTVDFDIYRRCPSLVIATVDKFARLPWKPEASSLFGIVDRRCGRCGYLTTTSDHSESRHYESRGGGATVPVRRLDPPDLIIQDELHLITGPLGTMVGLYETAVDYLCSFDAPGGTRPKIVASTATISGAERQMVRLFNRKGVCIFPCPVARPGNMFFWRESEVDGRLYVGASFSHRSMKFALARLYASLLQRAHELRLVGTDAAAVGPYWTLVGYFNSLRELGGATRLVEDDIPDNIRSLSERPPEHAPRGLSDPVEITGHVTGQDLRDVRRRLELGPSSEESIDVLLASSMISVGIDVERMGLMAIAGQPKTMSEYLQASGRIGRRKGVPGAVFTLFNPYKPRDLSHYEGFVGDHLKLQQAVEPSGITPFSEPAVDRAIHAVMISMIRHTIPSMSDNCDAENLEQNAQKIDAIKGAILDRFASVEDEDASSEKYGRLRSKLDRFVDNWRQYISEARQKSDRVCYADDSVYARYGNVKKKDKVLMEDFAAGGQPGQSFPWPTPGSLRDVESEARMFYGRAMEGAG